MPASPRRRTTARVVPVNARGGALLMHSHDETETILDHRWWAPEALESSAEVNNARLPALVRGAVAHVRNRR